MEKKILRCIANSSCGIFVGLAHTRGKALANAKQALGRNLIEEHKF